MKVFYTALISTMFVVVCLALGISSEAQNTEVSATESNFASPHLVISQFQVGSAASFNDEFIELHNTSSTGVDLNGYRLVYRSSGGTNDVAFVSWNNSTIIPPGGYYLITSTSYDGSVPGNISYDPTSCSCSMSGSSGGLAIRFGALNSGVIIDSVGYGSATNIFVETTPAATAPNDAGNARKTNGCQDTDNNLNDFSILNPAVPRNASSSAFSCSGGGGEQILANGGANPSTVSPNGTTLLTVSVFPATTPPSTGVSVVGNLTNIGGSANQQFFDNGTNGDVTPGDNIYSYQATVAGNTSGGQASITAVAADAQGRSANVTITLTINAPLPGEDPLLLGNPSNATPDVANENNYLMTKPQYSLSYNRSRASANWVAWRLDSSWIGSTPRQDDFRPDPALPANWYHVLDTDYSGSGYDRGHMCPSGDRTRSVPDNSATFLMTNMLPQYGPNNQGPWNDFENYLRTLANSGNEMYIFSGGVGNIGTIAQGRIVVPKYTWKVVVVLPNGTNDLQRISKATRTIAILIPNQPPLSASTPWRNFKTSIDDIEALTGYDFFSNIPKITQETIERRRDYQ